MLCTWGSRIGRWMHPLNHCCCLCCCFRRCWLHMQDLPGLPWKGIVRTAPHATLRERCPDGAVDRRRRLAVERRPEGHQLLRAVHRGHDAVRGRPPRHGRRLQRLGAARIADAYLECGRVNHYIIIIITEDEMDRNVGESQSLLRFLS
jgi:hypothetical protein